MIYRLSDGKYMTRGLLACFNPFLKSNKRELTFFLITVFYYLVLSCCFNGFLSNSTATLQQQYEYTRIRIRKQTNKQKLLTIDSRRPKRHSEILSHPSVSTVTVSTFPTTLLKTKHVLHWKCNVII